VRLTAIFEAHFSSSAREVPQIVIAGSAAATRPDQPVAKSFARADNPQDRRRPEIQSDPLPKRTRAPPATDFR
jgi:hypothetical protein